MKIAMRVGIVAVAILAVGGISYYGFLGGLDKAEAAVKVGQQMPPFTMKDYTGTEHSLEDFKGKVVVIQFSSQKCPYSEGADPQISAFFEKHQEDGVVVLGIDSHNATTPEQIAEYAQENELAHPILKDEGSVYAALVGAERTPEVFVLDKEGKVVYHGAWDSRRGTDYDADATMYTAEAVTAALAGETPETEQTKAWGCTIKWSDGAKEKAAEMKEAMMKEAGSEAKEEAPAAGGSGSY